jgi:ribosomal protein L35AE/L33A
MDGYQTPAKSTNSFYLGKKVAFVYRAQKEVRGSKIRVMWGKVTRPHGMKDNFSGLE